MQNSMAGSSASSPGRAARRDSGSESRRLSLPHDSQRTALLILGMHRSGTSALTRILSLLGASLPLHLIGPMRGNETGHWEPARLVALHDEMLAEAGSRWDDWRRFDTSRLLSDRVAHYKTAIKCLIKEEYGESPLLVLKDPRVCRFVGLYKEILPELGIAPAFILPLRNPLSILASLATRDDLSPPMLVWSGCATY